MATEIKVPSVGESITEGTVSRWLKKDGEQVHAEEPLYELETDKATTEIPAPVSGVLRVTVPEGKTVAIGSVVGRIEEGAPSAEKKARPEKREEERQAPRAAAKPEKPDGKTTREKPAPVVAERIEAPLSPSARRLAQEKQVDVKQLTGTGPAGRITKEDVLTHLEHKQERPSKADTEKPSAPAPKEAAPGMPPPAPAQAADKKPAEPSGARETRQRMTGIRQRIAEKLVAAQHAAAILTTFNEADLSAVMALRSRYKDSFKEKHGVSIGFMSFFVKAAVEALKSIPVVNARLDGGDVVYHHYYNVGVAVSTDRGLMVPVLRDAERMSFADIERRIAELAQKARDGKIAVDDLQGGTFTITNGGIFGSLLSTPILNPPQSAILGMHAIQKRPVAIEDHVVIRPMMYLALSYDHRLIDGRDAVLFLVRIKECIENPERIFLQI